METAFKGILTLLSAGFMLLFPALLLQVCGMQRAADVVGYTGMALMFLAAALVILFGLWYLWFVA